MGLNSANYSSSPVDLFRFLDANTTMLGHSNIFGTFILIIIAFVIFIALKDFTSGRALVTTSMVMVVLSTIFQAMGLVGWVTVLVFALMTIVSIFVMRTEGRV